MCSGGGFFLTCLPEKYKDYNQFFSFDMDYHCIKRIEGILRYYNVLDKALPLVADARKTPFKQNYFDTITNNCGFSQILGYSKALHEVFKILKPGGKMIIREIMGITRWNSSKLRSTIDFTIDELIQIHKQCDIYIDKERFLRVVENIGFSIDKTQDFKQYFVATLSKPE